MSEFIDAALWPGDKIRRKVEVVARQLHKRTVFFVEETRRDGVLIEQRYGWEFERIPTVPKVERSCCGARCRTGQPCQARVVVRKDGSLAKRCRNHGGLSTGPKTAAGREAIAEANRRRAKRSV